MCSSPRAATWPDVCSGCSTIVYLWMAVAQRTFVSCFDCIYLGDTNNPDLKNRAYFCKVYKRTMSYDMARTPNDCPSRTSDEVDDTNEAILDRVFGLCVDLVNDIHRPFTVRELFDYADEYRNKNSLWELMENLVKEGRLEKSVSRFRTWRKHIFPVNVYWPIL